CGGTCASWARKRLARKAGGQSRDLQGASRLVHKVVSTPGRPLEERVRDDLEPRFGHDFSRVRVHTDPQAARSAQCVGALAYTVGRHVVFASGQYRPATRDGMKLLVHELGHVVQQESAVATHTAPLQVMSPDDV